MFVSSTFKDLEAERNELREHVFPALRAMCAERGARFQEIDLRWGVSREASLDQQAMNVCLEEIDRCRAVTPRPNFVVLLGNRHGWRAPPPQIPAEEFETIREMVPEGADRDLLDRWYRRDDNAVPAEYRLVPRSGEHVRDEIWGPVEERLQTILADASDRTAAKGDPKYRASATEQEILRGALEVGAPEGRAFCFVRELTGHPDPAPAPPGDPVLDFVDPDQGPLDELKARLRAALPYRVYEARWDPAAKRPDPGHLEALGRDVREALERAIAEELENPAPRAARTAGPERVRPDERLDAEGEAHRAFAEDRCRIFVGREAELAAVAAYLEGDDPHPLVVAGGGGTGKSALLAEALRRAQADWAGAEFVSRFVGATAASSDIRSLLRGVCRELARRSGEDQTAVPATYQELTGDLRDRLSAAGARGRLVVFLDSLDQLAATPGARELGWLPAPLPPGVRMVVSTRPEDTLTALETRGAPVVRLGPLGSGEGRELLRRWMQEAHRTLEPAQEDEVLAKFAASEGNPLYLRLAFEEARRWRSGDREELAVGVPGIIAENTFGRLADEENHGMVLVSHALGYLAASRYGLAEDELLDLLSGDPDVYGWFLSGAQHLPADLLARATEYRGARATGEAEGPEEWLRSIRDRNGPELRSFLEDVLPRADGPRLPVVLWSRLLFDLEPYLAEREADGAALIAFFHRELGEVARARFLAARAAEYHDRMAAYFTPDLGPEGRPSWGAAPVRALSELPFHLIGAGRWDRLEETLTDFEFLEEKASRVAVERGTDREGGAVTTYGGVRRLQEDYDLALEGLGGSRAVERRRIVVTAVDLGHGTVVRCPHCNAVHTFGAECAACGQPHRLDDWRGREMACPVPGCEGPLTVNPFVVGGAVAAEGAPQAVPPALQTTEAGPELPLSGGATALLLEGEAGGEAGVNHWLVALLHRYGPMTESLCPGLEARPLARETEEEIRAGRTGAPMTREQLVAAAARHARSRGKDRVGERDLAAVILAAAGREVTGG